MFFKSEKAEEGMTEDLAQKRLHGVEPELLQKTGVKTQPKYITSSYIFSEEDMAKSVAKVRAVGGSLIVTIPKKVVEKEGIHEGEWVKLDVKKVKKDGFGIFPELGSFTKEDEFQSEL